MQPPRTQPAQIFTDLAWQRLFGAFDREGHALNQQIRRVIVHAVETGGLAAETRLPSSRQLASLLGIARNTVTAAYQLLIDEGFLVARERSGIFVAARQLPPRTSSEKSAPDENWAAHFAIQPSGLPQIDKPRDWLNFPYPFLAGQFDPAMFPTNNWREAVRASSSVKEIHGWAGDMVDDDDPALVEQLRIHVLPRRGILADPDEIIVTIGSQHALSMLVQLLVGRDTPVGVENPGYTDVRNMVRIVTSQMRSLNSDADGVIADDVLAGCKLAFITASHQCPTTTVMPLKRRQELLAMAAARDILLVEDDYEADLSVENDSAIPSLKCLDNSGHVLYVGSFSKVLAPGLRVGYVVAPRPVIRELRVLRRLMMRHPPTNNQRALATFIALGHYRQHLARTGRTIRERAELIARLMPQVMPTCRLLRGDGATSCWIEGPPGLDGHALVPVARAEGVLVEAGDIFFDDPRQGRRFLRLGFSSIATHRIEAGLTILGKVIARMDEKTETPPND